MVLLGHVNWTEWTAIGTLAAAVATVSLAGMTYLLARSTRTMASSETDALEQTKKLAAATARQATIASSALKLQLEPRIVPAQGSVPELGQTFQAASGRSGQQLWLTPLEVDILNAGSGIAQVTRVEIWVDGWSRPHGEAVFPGVLGSGMRATLRVEFVSPPITAAVSVPMSTLTFRSGNVVSTRVHYRGAGGREFQVAFAWTAGRSRGPWNLRQFDEVGHGDLEAELYGERS